jgi:hypothetical protein
VLRRWTEELEQKVAKFAKEKKKIRREEKHKIVRWMRPGRKVPHFVDAMMDLRYVSFLSSDLSRLPISSSRLSFAAFATFYSKDFLECS